MKITMRKIMDDHDDDGDYDGEDKGCDHKKYDDHDTNSLL